MRRHEFHFRIFQRLDAEPHPVAGASPDKDICRLRDRFGFAREAAYRCTLLTDASP
jgi:hypothetical protein